MTGRARFTPRARLDLIESAEYYLDEAGVEACDRFLGAARSTAEHLAATPRVGRVWQSGTASQQTSIRVWRVEGFSKVLLFYRIEDHGISIVRVLHGSRDLPSLLDGYL